MAGFINYENMKELRRISMIEIGIRNLSKYYGANKVIENITFEVKTGERIGLIGQNGSGKTTLFKIIAGLEEYNGGELTLRKGATIGFLEQIPLYPEGYEVIDVLKIPFEDVYKIKRDMEKLESKMSNMKGKELDIIMNKYGRLQQDFENMGGYDIEEKINRVSKGLHFDASFLNKKFSLLSGGEKTIVMLGKQLLENPDILLLDEPTNHLDFEAIDWLENFLNEYSGTVMIISHDRYFLDKVVTKIIEISDGKSELYLGNYSYYIDEKERRVLERLEEYKRQTKKIKSMEDAIRRFRDWGTRSDDPRFFRKAENMRKRIERMNKVEKPSLYNEKIGLTFNRSERSGKDVITVSKASKSFKNRTLIKEVDFYLKYLNRVAIIGKNGCGKSTFLKMILNRYMDISVGINNPMLEYIEDFSNYKLDEGTINIGANVRIGYLDQNVIFKNEDYTVLECLREIVPMSEGQARAILAKFLFYDEDVFKKVSMLSGGERSRLRLCQLMQKNINLLILDEPTNHLDIISREVLEQALIEFEGTILFVSHDRYFINKIADEIVELRDKKFINYKGNYDYYVEKIKEEKLKLEEDTNKKKLAKTEKSKGNLAIDKAKEEKKRLKKKQMIEEKISALEDRMKNLEIKLLEYSSDYNKLMEIYSQKEELQNEIDRLLEQWVELD